MSGLMPLSLSSLVSLLSRPTDTDREGLSEGDTTLCRGAWWDPWWSIPGPSILRSFPGGGPKSDLLSSTTRLPLSPGDGAL